MAALKSYKVKGLTLDRFKTSVKLRESSPGLWFRQSVCDTDVLALKRMLEAAYNKGVEDTQDKIKQARKAYLEAFGD